MLQPAIPLLHSWSEDYIYDYPCVILTHMLHGAGIFTYKTGAYG